MASSERKLVFGIYPGGAAGGDTGLLSGPPDDPRRIKDCLDELQGSSQPFVVRCYDSFQDLDSPLARAACAPQDYAQYAIPEIRPLELVLQYRAACGDVSGYLNFLKAKIEQHYPYLYAIQVTEEANFADGPNVIDGPYPRVREALTQGVVTARQILRELGKTDVKVGFNATPTFGPAANFWVALKKIGGETFVNALDYVGIDFFPDVFRPVAERGQPGDLSSSVSGVLSTMRNDWLPAAGIPDHVPIHITEHGWSTGPGRSAQRQAETLEAVIRTIHELSERLNIERYMLFDLRDVDHEGAGDDSIFRFFGITTADYSRKPAFNVFRKLVSEIGVSVPPLQSLSCLKRNQFASPRP